MFAEPLLTISSGALFGAALTTSGVYLPAIIIDQFRLADFHMFRVFATAVGMSAAVMLALDKLGVVARPVRPNSSLGRFSAYDGNVVGGAMVGAGMALSGACPGTVLVQVAHGLPSAWITAVGALLGGGAYLQLQHIIKRPSHQQMPEKRTISAVSQVPTGVLYFAFALAVIGILQATLPGTSSLLVAPATGGILIGLTQAASLLLTTRPLGVSTGYEQLSKSLLHFLGGHDLGKLRMPPKEIVFAVGIVTGSFALSQLGWGGDCSGVDLHIPKWQALLGGAVMTFGARLGGGCTSGHGLSGLAALSFSSLVTVVSMFSAGIVTRYFV